VEPRAISIHSLLEVVGRCALASQGVQPNADVCVRREMLDRLVREAEREMVPGRYAFSAPAVRIDVRAVGGLAVGGVSTS